MAGSQMSVRGGVLTSSVSSASGRTPGIEGDKVRNIEILGNISKSFGCGRFFFSLTLSEFIFTF